MIPKDAGGSAPADNKPKAETQTLKPTQDPTVIRSGDTGAVTGVVGPSGRVLSNLPPGHAELLMQGFQQQANRFGGAQEQSQLLAQQGQQQQLAALGSQIGQPTQNTMLSPEQSQGQPFDPNMKAAFLSALMDPQALTSTAAAVGALAYVGSSSAAGSVFGPYGTVAGAVVGLGIGVYSSVKKNIKDQKLNNIKEIKAVPSSVTKDANHLIQAIQLDPSNAEQYLEAFNLRLDQVSQGYTKLKLDTQGDLNLALSTEGTEAGIAYENFYAVGGTNDYLRQKMALALNAPNPDMAMQSLMMSLQLEDATQ
jgi:hypothetical protein